MFRAQIRRAFRSFLGQFYNLRDTRGPVENLDLLDGLRRRIFRSLWIKAEIGNLTAARDNREAAAIRKIFNQSNCRFLGRIQRGLTTGSVGHAEAVVYHQDGVHRLAGRNHRRVGLGIGPGHSKAEKEHTKSSQDQ